MWCPLIWASRAYTSEVSCSCCLCAILKLKPFLTVLLKMGSVVHMGWVECGEMQQIMSGVGRTFVRRWYVSLDHTSAWLHADSKFIENVRRSWWTSSDLGIGLDQQRGPWRTSLPWTSWRACWSFIAVTQKAVANGIRLKYGSSWNLIGNPKPAILRKRTPQSNGPGFRQPLQQPMRWIPSCPIWLFPTEPLGRRCRVGRASSRLFPIGTAIHASTFPASRPTRRRRRFLSLPVTPLGVGLARPRPVLGGWPAGPDLDCGTFKMAFRPITSCPGRKQSEPKDTKNATKGGAPCLPLAQKGCLAAEGGRQPPPQPGDVQGWRGPFPLGGGSLSLGAWCGGFFWVEMKGWVYGTSPELWGKCRECQSKAELRAGKKALDGGCALESALSLPAFPPDLGATLPNFWAAWRGSCGPWPRAGPGGGQGEPRRDRRAASGGSSPSPAWEEAVVEPAQVVVFPSLEAMAHLHFCALA